VIQAPRFNALVSVVSDKGHEARLVVGAVQVGVPDQRRLSCSESVSREDLEPMINGLLRLGVRLSWERARLGCPQKTFNQRVDRRPRLVGRVMVR
jgi:hypothetical protein